MSKYSPLFEPYIINGKAHCPICGRVIYLYHNELWCARCDYRRAFTSWDEEDRKVLEELGGI